jgi:hypothetical protein
MVGMWAYGQNMHWCAAWPKWVCSVLSVPGMLAVLVGWLGFLLFYPAAIVLAGWVLIELIYAAVRLVKGSPRA